VAAFVVSAFRLNQPRTRQFAAMKDHPYTIKVQPLPIITTGADDPTTGA
jgi:hypothetical protein